MGIFSGGFFCTREKERVSEKMAIIGQEDACVSDRIEEWQNIRKTAESPTPAANMSKNTGTLYDHNVYQKQEYKVEKPQLSPSTREKRQKRFSGQHPTGVELIKPNQDEFQDFLDMVDPIIKNAKGSSDDLFDIPDPDKDDMLSRKFSTGTPSPMPKHYGEVFHFNVPKRGSDSDTPKVAKSDRKIGNQSYRELAALPSRKFGN